MQLNTNQTKEMRIYLGWKELDLDPITHDVSEIACVAEFKLLGLMITGLLG